MSTLGNRFAGPAEFKQALISAFRNTVSPRVAPTSLFAPGDVVTEEVSTPPSQAPGALPLADWDPALLHQVEVTLAKHVGPIAALLVRRCTPTCHDLHTLCERLAEQVTNPGGGSDRDARTSASAGKNLGVIPDSLVTASAKVLAGCLGPIASLVARRAAAAAPDRVAYFGTLEEAIADPEKRHAVRTLLDKLH